MALNLSRNTRVWFTTNVNTATGVLADSASGFTASNTFELQVLDGYSFSQATNNQVITVNEAGAAPVRGQRSFNTALNPADFSFTTYLRPEKAAAGSVNPIERCLWNALFSSLPIDTVGSAAVTATTITRASTTSTSFTGLQVTMTPAPVVGEVYNIVGSTIPSFNQPFVITGVTGTAPNITLAGTFFKAPTTTVTSSVTNATTRIYKGAYAVSPTAAGSASYVSSLSSNVHQMQKFAMIFLVDNVFYAIDNSSINEATIDFGLDAIAQVQWSGNGTAIKQLTAVTAASQITAASGAATAAFITNKLTTLSISSGIGEGGTAFSVPITGGSITFSNNNTYLTPENLGVVNVPIAYFTGTRSITGNLTAYLRTGTTSETGALLTALLAAPQETKYRMKLEIGGVTNGTRVEVELPGVSLQVPTVDVQDVVSTTINFTAQPNDPTVANQMYNIENSNEALISYYSNATS